MTPEERQEILTKSKDFFRNRIIVNHKRNTAKLSTLKNFNVNPFMCKYLSAFAFGDAHLSQLRLEIKCNISAMTYWPHTHLRHQE